MTWYRRWRQPGGIFFFTLVTEDRRRILADADARRCLRQAIECTRNERPFGTIAMVLLPDHLHALWELPPEDDDFSTRWRLIKARFTRSWTAQRPPGACRSASRVKHGEQAVWQRRFWEHCIRDDRDLKRHIDYIHYNPVKHGLVPRAGDWPWSTFRRFVSLGEYDIAWGLVEPESIRAWSGAHE